MSNRIPLGVKFTFISKFLSLLTFNMGFVYKIQRKKYYSFESLLKIQLPFTNNSQHDSNNKEKNWICKK